MKINLAENMLRFGAKNLTEASKQKLVRLAEQAQPTTPGIPAPVVKGAKPAPIVKAEPTPPAIDWKKFTKDLMIPFVNRFNENEQDKNMPLIIDDMFILFNGTDIDTTAFGRKGLGAQVYKFKSAPTNMGQLPVIRRVGSFGVNVLNNTETKEYPGQLYGNEIEPDENIQFKIDANPQWNQMEAPGIYVNWFPQPIQTLKSQEIFNFVDNHDYTPYITSIQKATDANLTTKKINPTYLGYFAKLVKDKKISVINRIIDKLEIKPVQS